MKKTTILLDWRLLKVNENFRRIFIARMMSIIALGMLTVAVPLQIHVITGSSMQVGLVLALDGVGMFAGLMIGGVLADKYERRRLILIGRSACAIGFLALAINSFVAEPSLIAIYVLSIWSGIFGAIGLTALMAAMPQLVGAGNIGAAGALSMMTVRVGAAVSPMIGGVIISVADIAWNYTAAAIGTLLTLLPLARLPLMQVQHNRKEKPLTALLAGFTFVFSHNIIGVVAIIGLFDAMLRGVRVLFPAMVATVFAGGAFELGLLYSAVPIGAMLGALLSGWTKQLKSPGSVLIACSACSFIVIAAMMLSKLLIVSLILLAIYGYLSAISGLLQYTFIQGHTPNHLLGRANSVWTAQNVTGESIGAIGFGFADKLITPALSLVWITVVSSALSIAIWLGFKKIRHAAISNATR